MATLFFLRLAIRLARFTNKPLLNPLPYIEKMRALSDLTEGERSALSLHLILALQAQNTSLTEQQKSEMCRAWIYYKNTPLAPEWQNVMVEKEAFLYVTTTQEAAGIDQKGVLQEALNLIGIPSLPEHFTLCHSPFPNLRAEGKAGEFWEVNLLTGRICNEQGELIRGAIPDWIPKEKHSNLTDETRRFRHIFDGREHSYFKTGSTIYFQDPVLGSVRVINGNILKGLQRQIGAEWYQYIHPDTLDQKGIPAALLADHTHWVPLNNEENILWFCDFKTGNQRALLNHEGTIHPYNSKEGKVDTTRTLEIAFEEHVVERMEQKKYITFTKRAGGLEKMIFPRFRAQSNEIVEFEIEQGKAVYRLKKKFYLSEQQRGGILGGIPQYFILVDHKGEKEKVLIPARPLSYYQPLSTLHQIDTTDSTLPRRFESEYDTPQQGIYTCLEFDLKGEQLIPLTNEGILYLAYIYLAQRNYLNARELIDQIDFKQPLSPLSIEIINHLTALCEKDRSPSCAAVTIAAYLLIEQAQNRVKKPISCAKPERAYAIYYQYQHAIPAGLEIIPSQQSAPVKMYNSTSCVLDALPFRLDLKLPESSYGITEDTYAGRSNVSYATTKTQFLRNKNSSTYRQKVFLLTYYGKGYAANCFREAYEIARTGTEEEKEQLRLRLHLMEELRTDKTQTDSTLTERPMEWTILHFALNFPDQAPPLPDQTATVNDCYTFLTKCDEEIKNLTASSKTPSAIDPICGTSSHHVCIQTDCSPLYGDQTGALPLTTRINHKGGAR